MSESDRQEVTIGVGAFGDRPGPCLTIPEQRALAVKARDVVNYFIELDQGHNEYGDGDFARLTQKRYMQ